MLTRRTMSIKASEFFEGKIKKTGYFWFMGNHGWLVSNDPINKEFRKAENRAKPVDTYLFIDVLKNLDRFFEKEKIEEHLANLVSIIADYPNGQADNEFNSYLIENSKHHE